MKKTYIKYIILIILLVIQGSILISSEKKEEKKNFIDAVKVSSNERKDINEIFNDFKKINGVKINSIDNEDGIKINITFEGNKSDVSTFMDNILGYCISEYEISYQNEKFLLKLLLQEYKNKENI
ncbi:hypothetical protein [Clostridium sardiniense]|uniref:hypothetical protein n=1 Tax=Clostridium sardiniense TaxID=29369 RepID=UPI003D357C6A